MRKIKEVLRLAMVDGLSKRQITNVSNMGKSTAQDHLHRAQQAAFNSTGSGGDCFDNAMCESFFASAGMRTPRRLHDYKSPEPFTKLGLLHPAAESRFVQTL